MNDIFLQYNKNQANIHTKTNQKKKPTTSGLRS